MTPVANGTHAAPFGPPAQMLLLGFYDGPTAGVLRFGSGSVFHFVMPDEDEQLSRRSFPREYEFSPLPADALDRLEAVLAGHLTPVRPAWYVSWQFPTPEAERDADERVAAILAEAGPVAWRVTAPYWTFEDFRPSQVIALQTA